MSNANLMSKVTLVQALPSKEVDFLQLVDLLTGAVGYKFHKEKGSDAKLSILSTITSHLGQQLQPTSREEKKFNIFKFVPGGGW